MIAWLFQFGLFAYGDFTGMGVVLLLLSMIVYNCAFDFFNISGSLFLEQEIPLGSGRVYDSGKRFGYLFGCNAEWLGT
ncbi:TPA: hypothetical protein ACLFMB_004171 [Salmonella enterica subsp. diarizonae serovar 61:l,v:1,5,7]